MLFCKTLVNYKTLLQIFHSRIHARKKVWGGSKSQLPTPSLCFQQSQEAQPSLLETPEAPKYPQDKRHAGWTWHSYPGAQEAPRHNPGHREQERRETRAGPRAHAPSVRQQPPALQHSALGRGHSLKKHHTAHIFFSNNKYIDIHTNPF